MSTEKSKLFTKEYIIITFVNFAIALNFYLLMIIVADYAIKNYNSPPHEAGLAASIFILGALIFRIFAGKWIARVGYKNMLLIGLSANLIMSLMYFTITSIPILLAVRIFHGGAFGITTTSAGTIIADIVPKNRSGEGIGYYSLSVTLATAIGPFIGMFLSLHGSYHLIFTVSSAITAAGIAVSLFLSLRKIEYTEDQKKEMRSFKLSSFYEPVVIPIAIIFLLTCLLYSGVLSFLMVYAQKINLVDAAGFFFIIYSLAILISRPIVARLFDLKGENFIMYPAIVIFASGIMLFSQSYYSYMLLLSAVLIGLGLGAIQSSVQTIVVKITERHRLGLANSTFFIFADIGMGLGPFLVGSIIPYTGYRGMYFTVAIIAFACTWFYYLLHGRKSLKHRSN